MGIHVKVLGHFFIQLLLFIIWKYQALCSVVVNEQNGMSYGFGIQRTHSLRGKTEMYVNV